MMVIMAMAEIIRVISTNDDEMVGRGQGDNEEGRAVKIFWRDRFYRPITNGTHPHSYSFTLFRMVK